jgi:hypothetical protein
MPRIKVPPSELAIAENSDAIASLVGSFTSFSAYLRSLNSKKESSL